MWMYRVWVFLVTFMRRWLNLFDNSLFLLWFLGLWLFGVFYTSLQNGGKLHNYCNFFFLLQGCLVEGYRPIAVRNRCKQQGIVFGWKHLCCDCNSAFVVRYLWCEYHSGSCSLYLLFEFCHHSDFSWVFFWFWALISMWIAISTALVGITVSLRSSFCVS